MTKFLKKKTILDLIIIGTGPSGMTASIYASRYGLKHMIIGEVVGGLAIMAHQVCNFPTEESITGVKLLQKMRDVVEANGKQVSIDEVLKIKREAGVFHVYTRSGKIFLTLSILLATGTAHNKLNVPGEKKYLGKGVTYCSTCDGAFFKNKRVAVIGGGDSANVASLYMSNIASKVYQIVQGSARRGDAVWIKKLNNKKNVVLLVNNTIEEIIGNDCVEKVRLKNSYNGETHVALEGVFVEIGTVPVKVFVNQLELKIDDGGFINVQKDQSTNTEGVWASGDNTTGSNKFRQIITACSEGAIAAESISKYIKAKKSA